MTYYKCEPKIFPFNIWIFQVYVSSLQLFAFCLTFAFGLAAAFPQVPVPAPKGGGYAPDHYFQYINVPKHKVYEWGYKRGNKDHFREEYLSQKDHTFKAKVSVMKTPFS